MVYMFGMGSGSGYRGGGATQAFRTSWIRAWNCGFLLVQRAFIWDDLAPGFFTLAGRRRWHITV